MRPHNIRAVWSLSAMLTRMAYRGVTKHTLEMQVPAHKKQSGFSLGLEILSLTIAEILHRFESNFISLILDLDFSLLKSAQTLFPYEFSNYDSSAYRIRL